MKFKRSCHLIVPNNVKKKLYTDFKEGCINIPYCQKIIDRLLQENPVDKNGKVNGSLNPFDEPSTVTMVALHLPQLSKNITDMFGLTPEETFHVVYTLQIILMKQRSIFMGEGGE